MIFVSKNANIEFLKTEMKKNIFLSIFCVLTLINAILKLQKTPINEKKFFCCVSVNEGLCFHCFYILVRWFLISVLVLNYICFFIYMNIYFMCNNSYHQYLLCMWSTINQINYLNENSFGSLLNFVVQLNV